MDEILKDIFPGGRNHSCNELLALSSYFISDSRKGLTDKSEDPNEKLPLWEEPVKTMACAP